MGEKHRNGDILQILTSAKKKKKRALLTVSMSIQNQRSNKGLIAPLMQAHPLYSDMLRLLLCTGYETEWGCLH